MSNQMPGLSDTAARDDQLIFCEHVVVFIDVLGQKDAMAAIDKIPQNSEERTNFIKAMKNSAGRVDGVRKYIRQWVDSYLTAPSLLQSTTLTAEQRIEIGTTLQRDIQIQHFADTVIAFSPLASGVSHGIANIHAILAAACTTMQLTLAAGVAVRGGVDVGHALDWGKGDLYGPVLNRVHWLEEKAAQYPRIVVGDNLCRAVLTATRIDVTDNESAFVSKMAKQCLSLICQDVDGMKFVDFLGQGYLLLAGETVTAQQKKMALRFAEREYERHLQAGDQKLSLRYNLLQQYLVCRLNAAEDIYPTLAMLVSG
jgi:hypothetical protein